MTQHSAGVVLPLALYIVFSSYDSVFVADVLSAFHSLFLCRVSDSG